MTASNSPIKRTVQVIRAFFIALGYTLRGEKPASQIAAEQRDAQMVPLLTWCAQAVQLADAARSQADAAGLTQDARKSLKLRIEGRDTSLETVLATVRFHAAQEFPMLVRNEGEYALLAIRATLMNDRFLLMRFSAAEQVPTGVQQGLTTLNEHLAALPQD